MNVVVQDEFVYHKPSKLDTTICMDEMDRDEAEDSGRVPCSQCFPSHYQQASSRYSVQF